MSASTTTAVVGDIIVVTTSLIQQPHSGISLSVNESLFRNPGFDCHTRGHSVLYPQVVYYCTARRSGTVVIQANVTFCNIDWSSRIISITVEEQDDSKPTKLGKAMAAAYLSIVSILCGFCMCIL